MQALGSSEATERELRASQFFEWFDPSESLHAELASGFASGPIKHEGRGLNVRSGRSKCERWMVCATERCGGGAAVLDRARAHAREKEGPMP